MALLSWARNTRVGHQTWTPLSYLCQWNGLVWPVVDSVERRVGVTVSDEAPPSGPPE